MAFFKSSPPPKRNVIPVAVTPGRDHDLEQSSKQIPIQIQQKSAQTINNSPTPFSSANNGHQNGNNNKKEKPKIKVTGQALYIGSPRYPNTFYMDVDEDIVDVTKLGCAIQGYGQPEMWTNNRGDGRIEVSYRVGLVGKYKIHITYEGEHIEGSPFNCTLR